MSESASQIKDMLEDYERVKKELYELKNKLNTELKSDTEKSSESRICPICFQKPEVPVWYNGWRNGILEPCRASQNTPGCLYCIRKQINIALKDDKESIKCPWGCHTINLKRSKKYEIYGELGRNADSHPCEAVARALDDMGEGITECRRCGEECGSVWELGMHIKNKCSHRTTKCKLCKKSMKMYELEEHAKVCYHICSWCDEKDGVDAKPIVLKKDGLTDHYCPYKTLAKCRFCQNPITMDNIQSHKNCSLVKKGDLGIVCKKEHWEA